MTALHLRRRLVAFDVGRAPHVSVARERAAAYDAGVDALPPTSPAEVALERLEAALDVVRAVDWSGESNEVVRAASVGMQRLVNQLSAAALAPIEQLDARDAYGYDGAVTAASWLRNRTHMDPATAARLCTAARRVRRLPKLADAFAFGDVSLAHVTAVTEAAVPTRFAAISSVEPALVTLARNDKPHALRTALRAIRDVVDTDGSDPLPEPEPMDADENDARRYWHQYPALDGMVKGDYLVDAVTGEAITTLIDAFSTPDPPDTPPTSRRSPAQKRADAMRAGVFALLAAGAAPTVQGVKPHLLLMLDLLTVMGRDQAAVFASELQRTGRVSAATIARLGIDAKVTPVLTMGPYRVVAVGRTHRTLPPWLRPMMQMLHRHCRGPDCDRPACWTEAHHEDAYADGGDTDLNKTIPLCSTHHDLVTNGGWTVSLDLDTGICTWTSPHGRVIYTYPPR